MRTFDAQLVVEVDAEGVAEMLELLAEFTRNIVSTDKVRVLGFRYQGVKEKVKS